MSVPQEEDETKATLRITFDHFDKNGDGTVSVKEFGKVFRSLGKNVTEDEIKRMINEVDKDKNGKLNFEEFVDFITTHKCTQTQEEREADLQSAFKMIDKNKNGYISIKEFRSLLKNVGDRLSDEEVAEMIALVDTDNDGKLNYEEFVKILSL
ncbi:uncharacterized protein [Argopecten irradians]|uniref:uncharacterized protein isoform X2 n=1 Tax=Argopecten irradians TaxID=31199 RepID=UPI00370FE7C8